MDLPEFLLARIADDEAVARAANGRVAWLTLRKPDGSMRYTTVAHQHHDDHYWIADGHAIDAQTVDVFYDSARVLAECEAKRRIVEEYQQAAGDEEMPAEWNDGYVCGQEFVLKLLTLPYADHPDYDEAWRP